MTRVDLLSLAPVTTGCVFSIDVDEQLAFLADEVAGLRHLYAGYAENFRLYATLLSKQLQAAEKDVRDLSSAEHKRCLILKNSHIGGHKFAGNVIVSGDFLQAR